MELTVFPRTILSYAIIKEVAHVGDAAATKFVFVLIMGIQRLLAHAILLAIHHGRILESSVRKSSSDSLRINPLVSIVLSRLQKKYTQETLKTIKFPKFIILFYRLNRGNALCIVLNICFLRRRVKI
jgi:hypothetical protein